MKASGIKRLNLNRDEPLSSFAFEFNLRRYNKGKRAVVVGNGPSVLHSNMGAVVDGYDHVYRFNLFKTKVRLDTEHGS